MENKSFNFEKIGIYIAVMTGFFTLIFYIADLKERTAIIETKIKYLEQTINYPHIPSEHSCCDGSHASRKT